MFLGHLTGLTFCVFIKLYHPQIFKMQDCYSFLKCLEWKIVKELGVFKDGIVLAYSFLPPKDYKPTFQAKWNTKHLLGINWNNRKLKFTELSSIIHQPCSPTTEYFAKGLEKCNLLSNYLFKDVENLNDLGCPKVSKLLNNADTDWDIRIDTKRQFTVPRRKHMLMKVGLLIFLITYNICNF